MITLRVVVGDNGNFMKKLFVLVFALLVFSVEISAQRFVQSFNTIADLLAANPNSVHTNAYVLGYYAPNDGGGGPFTYYGSSAVATNFGSRLKPNSHNGRWFADFSGSDGEIDVRRFGAKGDGITDDTLQIQSAIDWAEVQTPIVGNLYPAGNYLISSVTIKRASQRGVSKEHLHTLGSQQMGSRITQKIGATNDCFIVRGDHLSGLEIANLSFVGNREDNLKNTFTITSASTRTNFVVNTGSGTWPSAPASPSVWPHYGYCFFFTSENKYAGAGLVVNRNTGTGAVDLMPLTDTYATVTNSSYLLTAGMKVCFAENATETAGFKTTTGIDSSRAGYAGINITSDSVNKLVTKINIRQVQMWHWHTGIRIGNALANTLENVWIGTCSFAGIAGAFPGDNRDDLFINIFIQGYYTRSNTGTTETLVLENTTYRKNLWGIYGLPSAGNMEMVSLDNNVNGLFVKDCLETKVGSLHIDASNGPGILFGGGLPTTDRAQSHFDHVVMRNINSSLYSLVGPPALNPFYAIDVFGSNNAADIENLEILPFGVVRYFNAVFNAPVAHRISVDSMYTFAGATNLFSSTTTSFPPISNLRLANSMLATSVGGVTNLTFEQTAVTARVPLVAATTFTSTGDATFTTNATINGTLTGNHLTYLKSNTWVQGNTYLGTNLAQAKFTIYKDGFNATDSKGIFHFWGADSTTGDGRTDNTSKEWRLLTAAYTNANPRFLTLWGNNQQAHNRLWLGGGDNAAETASDIRVYTGTKGQLGGTNHFQIDGSGNVIIPDAARLRFTDAAGNMELTGNGSPEGIVAAPVGSTYRRKNGGASTTFYVKESGTGNTGWVALGPPGAGGVAPSRQILTTQSLTGGGDLGTDRTLSLVNDTASPGNNKVYGTDGSGVRGWKNDPAGGGVSDGDKGDVVVSSSGSVWKLDTGFIRTFETMNDMVTASMTGSTNFFLMGYYAPNDGGGGRFYYDASSSSLTNYGMVIKPTTGAGRLIRIVENGILSVKDFGAKGDGVTDDTVRIQQTADEAYILPGKPGIVYFPPGVYRGYIEIPEFVTVMGASQEGQKNVNEGSSILKLPDGTSNISVVTINQECTLKNMQIDGNKANVSATSHGIFIQNTGIYIESTIEYVSVVNAKSAGIYIDGHEITIRNSSVIESENDGIYIEDNVYDVTLNKVLIGWNGGPSGLRAGTGGAGHRFTQVDVYFSRGNGVTLVDPNLTKIDRLQIDFSFNHGLEIQSSSGSPALFVDMPLIYGSNANDDGRGRTNSAATGTYSDVIITGTAYPSSITFRDGRIGPIIAGLAKKPEYVFKWANSADVGWGMHFYDVNVDTINGTRVTSGKSMQDSMMASKYWNGRLINYYDGTNALTLVRDSAIFHKHNYTDPPAIVVDGGTVTVSTNVIIPSTLRLGGATSGRTLNVDKLGIQIKSDTGETFGLSNFGDSFYLGSESASDPSFQMQGPTGNTTLLSSAARTSGIDKPLKIQYTLNQASGTAGSTGLSLETTSTAIGSGEHNFLKAIDDGFPRFEMRLDGRFIVTSTNGIAAHVFRGDTATDSQIYLHTAQTLDRRMTLTGNSINVTQTDGSTAQALALNSNGALVTVGGYLQAASGIQYGSTTRFDRYGSGTPESVVTADVGSTWRRTDGGANTTLYVKESGSGNTGWVAYGAPSGGGVSDGDKGDISVTSSGATWTIDNDVVTNAKAANMAASTIKARVTGSTGDPEDATLSQVLDLVGSAANGDMLVRSGGSWGRLPAPTGVFPAQLYNGPDGFEWVSARTHYIFTEDWVYHGLVGYAGWGSGGSSANINSEAQASGIMGVTTSTSSTGVRALTPNSANLVFGEGQVVGQFRCRIPTLSTSGERFTVHVGFLDGESGGTDGAYFRYVDNVSGGDWEACTESNNSITATDSTIAATTDWTNFQIVVNAAGSEVKFYINSTLVRTETLTIPTGATRATSFGFGIAKSVGTTQRDFYSDYIQVYKKFTTAR